MANLDDLDDLEEVGDQSVPPMMSSEPPPEFAEAERQRKRQLDE